MAPHNRDAANDQRAHLSIANHPAPEEAFGDQIRHAQVVAQIEAPMSGRREVVGLFLDQKSGRAQSLAPDLGRVDMIVVGNAIEESAIGVPQRREARCPKGRGPEQEFGVVLAGKRRGEDAAGAQHAENLGQHGVVVRDVLDDAVADDRIEGGIGIRQLSRAGEHDRAIYVTAGGGLTQIASEDVDPHVDRQTLVGNRCEVAIAASDVQHRRDERHPRHELALHRTQNRPMRGHVLQLLSEIVSVQAGLTLSASWSAVKYATHYEIDGQTTPKKTEHQPQGDIPGRIPEMYRMHAGR